MVFVLFLIFLFPLVVYCFFLGAINRREMPVRIPGHLDVLALFLGLSGFFLAVVPGILSILYTKAIGDLAFEDSGGNWNAYETAWAKWSLGFILYYALVAAGLIISMYSRRNKWVVYNIHVPTFEKLLTEIALRRGWHAVRVGKTFVVDRFAAGSTAESFGNDHDIIFYMDAMETFHHATLTWMTDDPVLRGELQVEIVGKWNQAYVPDNAFGAWILWIGVGLFEVFWFFSCLLARAFLF